MIGVYLFLGILLVAGGIIVVIQLNKEKEENLYLERDTLADNFYPELTKGHTHGFEICCLPIEDRYLIGLVPFGKDGKVPEKQWFGIPKEARIPEMKGTRNKDFNIVTYMPKSLNSLPKNYEGTPKDFANESMELSQRISEREFIKKREISDLSLLRDMGEGLSPKRVEEIVKIFNTIKKEMDTKDEPKRKKFS